MPPSQPGVVLPNLEGLQSGGVLSTGAFIPVELRYATLPAPGCVPQPGRSPVLNCLPNVYEGFTA